MGSIQKVTYNKFPVQVTLKTCTYKEFYIITKMALTAIL